MSKQTNEKSNVDINEVNNFKLLFSISRNALFNHVKEHVKNINKNNAIPILDNILFSFKGPELSLISDNLEVHLESKIRYNRSIDSKDIDILIDANLLINILKNLSEQPLEFFIGKSIDETDIKNILRIKHNKGYGDIIYYNADDYPKINIIKSKSFVLFNANIKEGMNYVSSYISKDESQPALNGVLFKIEKGILNIVAADGNSLGLAKYQIDKNIKDFNVLLPIKGVIILKNLLSFYKEDIFIKLNKSHIQFEINNFIINCRLLDDKFPAYENIIDEKNKILKVNKKLLVNAIKSTSLFTEKETSLIVMEISDQIIISGIDEAENKQGISIIKDYEYKEISLKKDKGKDDKINKKVKKDIFKIGFAYDKMLNTLNKIKSESVVLEMSNPNNAIHIKESNSDKFLGVIMPRLIF